jgi:flagella basal body P-ring formation protein FlgA
MLEQRSPITEHAPACLLTLRPAHPRLSGLLVLLGIVIVLNSPAGQADNADEDAALTAIHQFLIERTDQMDREAVIEVQPSRATLPPCESPQPFLPRASQTLSGRVTVGVRCGEDGRQVRYFRADIGLYGTYPVLSRPVTTGDLISPQMLEEQQGNLSELPRDAVREAESVIGKIARRSVEAGTPLRESQFKVRPLVERGQRVVVEARGQSFQVSREGVAMDAGVLGDRVRVQFSNRERIEAVIVGEGRLEVSF